MKKCPNCGAANAEGAEWCTMCLQRFDGEEPGTETPAEGQVQVEPTEVVSELRELTTDGGAQDRTSEELATQDPDTGDVSKIATWTCKTCEATNPLEENVCSVCGRSIFEAFGATQDRPALRDDADGSVAAVLSFIPGAGHLYLERYGDAGARFLIFAWWVGTFWLLGGAPATLIPLRWLILVSVLGYMVVTAIDAYRAVEEPTTKPLIGRAFYIWASLTFVLLLGAGGLLAFFSATAGG